MIGTTIIRDGRDGEYFRYSYGLVFTNRLFSLILSALLVWFFERESLTLSTAPLYEYSFPSGQRFIDQHPCPTYAPIFFQSMT